MQKTAFAAVLAVSCASVALAKDFYGDVDHPVTPLTVAVADPVQFPFNNWKTYGLRLNIFDGRSFSVRGVDLGLVGMTQNDFRGVSACTANWVEGDMYGIQLGCLGNVVNGYTWALQASGIINYNQSAFSGLQMSLINFNSALFGFQAGLLNWDRGICYGLELGGVNVNDNEFHGWTVGAINYSERLFGTQIGLVNVVPGKGRGLQFGVFNAACAFQGVQIGLLNIIGDGAMPIFPVINANF
ncbi:MAG: hypothetical protein IKD42_05105 [Kiritimatiellae bacterium]|nr:hypothetical protein [Kiritimatiellia bacterium]